MKVVAHVGPRHVLVESEVGELAKIMGLTYTHELPEYSRHHGSDAGSFTRSYFHLGKVIEVDKLWEIIQHERTRPKEITGMVRNLRSLADMLEGVSAALPTPPTQAPEREGA